MYEYDTSSLHVDYCCCCCSSHLTHHYNAVRGHKFTRVCSVRYRYSRYRYGCRTEVTEMSGTGIDVAPNLPKCPVPVLMLYRTYRSVRYRYESLYRYRRYRYPYRTELTEVSGTGVDVVPNLPECPVPVLMSY